MAKSPILQSYFHPFLWMDERQYNGDAVKAYDAAVWQHAYEIGYRKPNYPVPATLENADISIGWTHLTLCPFGLCAACLDNYLSAIEDSLH